MTGSAKAELERLFPPTADLALEVGREWGECAWTMQRALRREVTVRYLARLLDLPPEILRGAAGIVAG